MRKKMTNREKIKLDLTNHRAGFSAPKKKFFRPIREPEKKKIDPKRDF